MEVLHIYVSIPVTGFRVAQAREYWETYLCPPPPTVYGMLLSLVGVKNRLIHKGAEIALALVSEPQTSVVLRTLWRVKDKKLGLGFDANARPDFQELLSDVQLSVWVRRGSGEEAQRSLLDRLMEAIANPACVKRHGGLCLGESTHLVDEVRPWRQSDPSTGRLLILDDRGEMSLPIWPDHVGSKGTCWGQFRLEVMGPIYAQPANEHAWVTIAPPEAS